MKNKNLKNIVATNIRHLRHRENWSQAIVAEKLDMSIPAFSKIETGTTDCNITRLFQIAAIFSVHVLDIILTEEDSRKHKQSDEIQLLKEKIQLKEEEIFKLQLRTISLYEQLRENK